MAKRHYKAKGMNVRWGAVIAVIMALIIVVGVCCMGYASRDVNGAWFRNSDLSTWHWSDSAKDEGKKTNVVAVSGTGKKMLSGNSYSLPSAMSFLSINKNAAYSPDREFNVTATLSNQYVNGKFDWAVTFKDESTTWATGKTPEYYIQVSPTADGSATATVKYLAAFNEPIIVTATLRGTDKSDNCQIDCVKNLEMTGCWLDASDFGDCLDGGCYLDGTTGTVFAEYKIKYARIELDISIIEAVQSYLKFDIQMHSYDFTELYKDTTLGIEEQQDYHLQLSFATRHELSYGDFIDNFEDYDEAHKEAIYYAFYQALKDTTVIFELSVDAYVYGVNINANLGYDDIFDLSGEKFGINAQPNVSLNTNVVF